MRHPVVISSCQPRGRLRTASDPGEPARVSARVRLRRRHGFGQRDGRHERERRHDRRGGRRGHGRHGRHRRRGRHERRRRYGRRGGHDGDGWYGRHRRRHGGHGGARPAPAVEQRDAAARAGTGTGGAAGRGGAAGTGTAGAAGRGGAAGTGTGGGATAGTTGTGGQRRRLRDAAARRAS